MNAGAGPNGLIVVNRGIVEYAANEEEVCLVIAHEMGHQAANHLATSQRNRGWRSGRALPWPSSSRNPCARCSMRPSTWRSRATLSRPEGVEIRFTSSPRPQDAALRLMDGTVDVCWGGPMRVMETYQAPDCDIVCFAEVVTRDPFLLMGRAPRPDFTLADLKSARLATVSEVPTPWLCLQHDLRLAGIDPAGIARVADQTMAGTWRR